MVLTLVSKIELEKLGTWTCVLYKTRKNIEYLQEYFSYVEISLIIMWSLKLIIF